MEALTAKLCPGSHDEHVTAMDRTEVRSTEGVATVVQMSLKSVGPMPRMQ